MAGAIDAFVAGLRSRRTGGVVTTVRELKENQYGIPLRHYAQQYLFGATGLRIQVFNSIQGQKEAGKSTLMFDLMGDVCAAEADGGCGGIGVIYELESKLSPSILYSILKRHGDAAVDACIPRLGMTLEEAMADLNKEILPTYKKTFPKRDKPLIIGLDSIGGSASEDTIGKLESEGTAGKGFYNKQHFMKYWCENQGPIFSRENIPVVVICINQEREQASATPFGPPQKTITGGKAQLFKDGHMISARKEALRTGDGNLLHLKTTKTSFCDPRAVDVQFRWNKYGEKVDDMYEARFLWGLASAQCLAAPDKGVGEIRDICDVKISDQGLVTCPQLGLKSVQPDEFEAALMASGDLLRQLYVYQKIEVLGDIRAFSESLAPKEEPKADEKKPEEKKPKARPKAKAKEPEKPAGTPLFDVPVDAKEGADV